MTHANLPGGWRANTLQDAVMGVLPIDRALHLVGVHKTDKSAAATKARQDLDDAVAAYQAGDELSAMATAADLAEELRRTRQPGRGAAA